MQKYWNTVQDERGNPRYGASVSVQQNGVNSSIYSDSSGLVPAANPLTTDATRGYFEFYAAAGTYDLVIFGVGFTSYTITAGANLGLPSGDVTFTQSGTGAVAETIAGYLGRLAIPATSFMTDAQRADVAAGTASLDVTTAVQAALTTGKDVYFPKGTYLITAKLTTVGNQRLFGDGKFMSVIKKGANITMLDLNDHCELYGLGFNGVGGTYTGKGIDVTTGGYQKIVSTRIYDTASNPITFVGAQIGTCCTVGPDVFAYSTTLTNHAIVLPNDGLLAGNRMFIDIQCEGGWLIDFSAGANMNTVIGCHTIGVTYGDNSKKCALIGNRLATNAITIKGVDHTITGNTVAAGFTLAANTATCMVRGNVTVTETVDNSGLATNKIDQNAVTYTPTVTASGGGFALGNGTVTGSYTRQGSYVLAKMILTVGGTTNLGVGYLQFTTPYTAYNDGITSLGSASTVGTGTKMGISRLNSNTNLAFAMSDAGFWGVGVPFAWAAGDTLTMTIAFFMG